jgi:hypothetical protein
MPPLDNKTHLRLRSLAAASVRCEDAMRRTKAAPKCSVTLFVQTCNRRRLGYGPDVVLYTLWAHSSLRVGIEQEQAVGDPIS